MFSNSKKKLHLAVIFIIVIFFIIIHVDRSLGWYVCCLWWLTWSACLSREKRFAFAFVSLFATKWTPLLIPSSLSSLNSLFLLFGESDVVLSPLHDLNQLSWLLSSSFSWPSFSSSIFKPLIFGPSLSFLSFFGISQTTFVSCDDWELKTF